MLYEVITEPLSTGRFDNASKMGVAAAAGVALGAAAAVAGRRRQAAGDLVTEMIKDGKEFTSLQGVMGHEYARRNGERPITSYNVCYTKLLRSRSRFDEPAANRSSASTLSPCRAGRRR